ncbi:unnamed protein product [Fraxinus pennsylvanica]|uniref:Inhibitor I9 domain-containing protein n=1 Tax=Fraxinus pennsylvanica TaxID=56036 RepID=A0AAD1ZMU1_9LAMI|nr:unnamed protein product [Fraxinus pennsylvanica]
MEVELMGRRWWKRGRKESTWWSTSRSRGEAAFKFERKVGRFFSSCVNCLKDHLYITSHGFHFAVSYSKEKVKDSIIQSYKRHINGFAVVLEEEDASEIAREQFVDEWQF